MQAALRRTAMGEQAAMQPTRRREINVGLTATRSFPRQAHNLTPILIIAPTIDGHHKNALPKSPPANSPTIVKEKNKQSTRMDVVVIE